MDSPAALPVAVSALAAAIARQIPDDLQLALTAALLTQLGDTLATIAALRALEQPPAAQ